MMSKVDKKNLPSAENRKKFDIIKTFEIFNKENMSILKNKIIEIILVEADNIFSIPKQKWFSDLGKPESLEINVISENRITNSQPTCYKNKKLFNVDFKKNNAAQISVFNDRRTYDLLSNTWKRHKMKQEKLNDKNNKSRLFGQLTRS